MRGSAVPLQGRRAQVGSEVGAGEEGDPLLEGREGESLGVLLAGRPLQRHNRDAGDRGLGRPPPSMHTRRRLLTAEGPVAGSPSVMLGRDGDVYRGSGATEPSRVTSLCAKPVWRQNTRRPSHAVGSPTSAASTRLEK